MSWKRAVSVLLALLVAVAGVAQPASADPVKSPRATPLANSIAKVGALKPGTRVLAQTGAQPAAGAADDRPFFQTRNGVIAIVLMVAGAAYVAYKIPKDNSKVHSPIR